MRQGPGTAVDAGPNASGMQVWAPLVTLWIVTVIAALLAPVGLTLAQHLRPPLPQAK